MLDRDITTSEIWRPIPSTNGVYEASSLGRIRSVPRFRRALYGRMYLLKGKVLSPLIRRKGYVEFRLRVDNRQRAATAHQLVSEAFLGPKPTGMQVNHINGVKADNRPGNLEYLTISANVLHSFRVLSRKNQKVSYEQAQEVRQLSRGGVSNRRIAEKFGVSKTHVWAIINNKCHV